MIGCFVVTFQWSRHVGQLSEPSVRVPLHPCEHFYIVTKAIEGIDPMMPGIPYFKTIKLWLSISQFEWQSVTVYSGKHKFTDMITEGR